MHWKIRVPILVIVLYSTGVAWALSKVGFWHLYLLTDTAVWVMASGVALGMSGVSLSSNVSNWRGVVTEQVKAVVLVEYLVNTYTFSIWAELALVPLLPAVGTVTAFASKDEKSVAVAKLGQFLQGAIGLVIILFAVKSAFNQADTFSLSVSLRELLLPVVLSASLLPLMYLLALISAYEQLFLVLMFGEKKKASLIRYAKWRLFWVCGFRLAAVRSLLQEHRHDLLWATSKTDVEAILNPPVRRAATDSK